MGRKAATPKGTAASKGKKKPIQPEAVVESALPEPPKPELPIFTQFDAYVQVHSAGEEYRPKIGVDFYDRYILFPIDSQKQTQHLPGGYLWAAISGYSPGSLARDRPHHWVGIYDGDNGSMRRWCYSLHEAEDVLEEITILRPISFSDLESLGFRQE